MRVLTKVNPNMKPRTVRYRLRCILKCATMNAKLEATIAATAGMYLVKLESRKPLNIASSQTGVHTDTTKKYRTFAAVLPYVMDCSRGDVSASGGCTNHAWETCERRSMMGNVRQDAATQSSMEAVGLTSKSPILQNLCGLTDCVMTVSVRRRLVRSHMQYPSAWPYVARHSASVPSTRGTIVAVWPPTRKNMNIHNVMTSTIFCTSQGISGKVLLLADGHVCTTGKA